ncbi:hypothetical protein D3C80_1114000 [compost metagenome]
MAMVVETKPNGIRTPVRIVVKFRTSMSKSSTAVEAAPPGMVVTLPAASPIRVYCASRITGSLCGPASPAMSTVLLRGMISPAFSCVASDSFSRAGRGVSLGQVVACKATGIGNMAPFSSRASAGMTMPASRMVPRAMTPPSGRWMVEVVTQS